MNPYHDQRQEDLVLIQAYFDESGIQDGAGICVIAGYFGGPGQMKRFGNKWAEVLRRYEVPEFHSKEFWAFNGGGQRAARPYRGWSDEKANDFLESLLSLIERHKIHPVSSAVVVEDFNRLSYSHRRFVTGGQIVNGKFVTSGCPSKPYFLPFQAVVTDAADHTPIGSKAHFFFDLNKEFKGYALDLYALLKSQGLKVTDRLGNISFLNGVDAVQLQAADLLCYQSYHYGLKLIENPREKTGLILDRLLTNRLSHADTLFNEKTIPLLTNDVRMLNQERA